MHAKAKVLSVSPTASAGTSSKASSMLLIAGDNVPRVNTNRRRISLTKYGMLKASDHGDEPGRDVHQRHRSCGPKQLQRLQRDDSEQYCLRHGGDEEQAEEG